MFNFVRNCQMSSKVTVPFYIPTQQWVSVAPYPHLQLVCQFWDFNCCNRYIMASHHCFNLQFPNVMGCWTSFHMPICHFLDLLWWSICSDFAHFLIGLFVFLLLSFKTTLYILDKSFIRYVFLQIFSPNIWHIFVPLTLSFEEQKFLILVKPNLPIFHS